MNSILLFLLCASASTAIAADVPRKMHVTYQVTYQGMNIGKGVERFEHDTKTYNIVSETKTVGTAALLYNLKINREARGSITRAGLQPASFVEDHSKKPRKSVKFDWANRQVSLQNGDSAQKLPFPEAPLFDQTSFAWSFAFNPPKGKEGKVVLTDGRKLSEYRYEVMGKEKISTPLGKMDALHVKKIQEDGDKRGFEVWLATDQFYLPVRILFSDNRSTIDSVVSAIDIPRQ